MHPQHPCPVSQCYSSNSERLCSAHASLNAECDLCLGRSFSSFARRKGIKPGFSLLSSFGVARSTSSVACRLQLRPGVWSMCRTCLSACTIYLEVAIMESRQRLYDRASELIIEGNGRHDTKLHEGSERCLRVQNWHGEFQALTLAKSQENGWNQQAQFLRFFSASM